MFKILFILYLLKCTSSVSDDESYEKYIDLLPEKEKEEFLNRIARRLLEEIKSDQVPNQSQIDVNDDQLEAHDSLVQNIMREETDKLKDEKMQDNFEKTDRIVDDNKSEEKYIDLTLREGKRQKRKNYSDEVIETTSEFDYNVIPVKTVTDDAKVEKENDREYSIEAKQQDTDVIPLAVRDTAGKNSVENEPSSLNDNNNVSPNNSKQLLETTELVTETNNDQTETTIEGDNTKQNSKENIDKITGKDENSVKENINSKIYINSTTIENEDINNTIYNTTNTESVISSLHEDENKIETVNKNNVKQIQNNERANTTKSDIIKTTENFPRLTTASINPFEKDARSTKVLAVRKSHKVTINVGNKAHVSKENIVETKEALRLGPDSKTNKNVFTNHEKIKEYEVFEVAAKKPAFSLRNKKVSEQPNYVPVYNYSPENAYFRPYDRFGPNRDNIRHESINKDEYIDRESEEEDDTNFKLNIPNMRSRFVGYNNKQNIPFRPNSYNINKRAKYGIYDFMRPAHRNIFHRNILYNPYDYLDMDYGYKVLRKNVKHFPDSNEADHPYNSMHKSDSVKDHLRAVRKLLYLQNKFGYVPDVKDKVRKFNKFKKPTKSDKKNVRLLQDPINDNIAVDYYFGREKSSEEKNDSFDNKPKVEENVNLDMKEIVVDRNKFYSFLNDMMQVLEDMVKFDNSALEQYAWLITTVDIQTAVRKLINLSEGVLYGEDIHPKDIELLKYNLYLFKSSKISLDDKKSIEKQNFRYKPFKKRKPIYKKSRGLLPHNRYRGKIKQPLNFWKDFAKFIRNEAEIKGTKLTLLYEFEDFLQNILFHLNGFHDAIKHIAIITKFNNQKWFKDLKDIYFNGANKKQLAKVILHISLFDLLEGIEKDAVNGVEVDFKDFVKNNVEEVNRTKEKFVFVLRVLEDLNKV